MVSFPATPLSKSANIETMSATQFPPVGVLPTMHLPEAFAASKCVHCNTFALWCGDSLIYPNTTTAPLPTEDMPDEIKEDFNEARQVFPLSARSSAALLRLSIEKLSKHLGCFGQCKWDHLTVQTGPTPCKRTIQTGPTPT